MRKRVWKRTAAVTLTAVMAAGSVCIGGCGVTDKENGGEADISGTTADAEVSGAEEMKSDGKDVAMGRYLEEDTALPEGCTDIGDMCLLDSGVLRICYVSDEQWRYADSSDGGATWGEGKSLNELMGVDETRHMIGYPKLGAGGDIFAFGLPISDETETSGTDAGYYYLAADGTAKNLDIGSQISSGYCSEAWITENGTVVINDIGQALLEFRLEDGSLVNKYEEGSAVQFFSVYENTLIAVVNNMIHYYDLKTGKPLEDASSLTEELTSNEKNLEMYSTATTPVVFSKGNDGSLFFAESAGVYRYSFGGSVVEQVIDGDLNRISSPDTGLVAMCQDQEGNIYLAIQDTSAVSGYTGKILKYVYSEDTPAVPDTELTVYSLTDNNYLRQIAAIFQKENPDIYLNIEVGITDGSAVTNTDALKNLNTEIMAGNGPDVLILDGIPEDTYVEKGMLKDISGILDKVQESDGLLENIRNAYVNEDGSQYVMPAKFAIPLIWGQKADLDAAGDNTSMADMLEKYQSEYSDEIYPVTQVMAGAEGFLRTMADVNEPAWLDEEGNLDEKAVSDYLEQTGRIYRLGQKAADRLKESGFEVNSRSELKTFQGLSGNTVLMMSGNCKLALGRLCSPNDLAYVVSAERETEGLTHGLWNGQAENCFIPIQTVGISAKAAQTEAAERLVEFMFTQEGQKIGADEGLPVNETVYDGEEYWAIGNEDGMVAIMSSVDNRTGESVEITVSRADEESTKEIQELGKSLTRAAKENEIILSAVAENGAKYLEGECSLEDAVKAAGQEIGIYLAE